MLKNQNRWKEYTIAHSKFLNIDNPTPQQCLEYLRLINTFNFNWALLYNIKYVPEEHRAFCETQLKLEGLL